MVIEFAFLCDYSFFLGRHTIILLDIRHQNYVANH